MEPDDLHREWVRRVEEAALIELQGYARPPLIMTPINATGLFTPLRTPRPRPGIALGGVSEPRNAPSQAETVDWWA
jgi:hypothetical protein